MGRKELWHRNPLRIDDSSPSFKVDDEFNYIGLTTKKNIEFFGYQLLEFLLSTVTQHQAKPIISENTPEGIIRVKEVPSMAGRAIKSHFMAVRE
ncbi:hypothetical protein [Bathymodiolus thermophilus thioautotrophic gill symbiont]|uniref:Uncharacterized protein n=1 Tax=Bathymodiolus thermophilus thioautotrophic gill symbiont TaxID=2360 RepID=A0A1J5TUE9_9GAMM|nr:hypothetical protein [Bathymodiolus thermophilus thioautotrophic gill symbiont]OIR24443.1 hypothetical protein BGC33_10505 [Bathymodiolus thermophilus thioautotrophic gill symbiont]